VNETQALALIRSDMEIAIAAASRRKTTDVHYYAHRSGVLKFLISSIDSTLIQLDNGPDDDVRLSESPDLVDRTFDNDEARFSEVALVCDHCGAAVEIDPKVPPFYRHIVSESGFCGPRDARLEAHVNGKRMNERRGSGRKERRGA
jgi:hypothetical protein